VVAPTCAWGMVWWFCERHCQLFMRIQRMKTGCLGHMQRHIDMECCRRVNMSRVPYE